MFGKYDKKGKLIPASMELVRLAIPRRVYTQSHIEYVIEVFEELIKNKCNGLPESVSPKVSKRHCEKSSSNF